MRSLGKSQTSAIWCYQCHDFSEHNLLSIDKTKVTNNFINPSCSYGLGVRPSECH